MSAYTHEELDDLICQLLDTAEAVDLFEEADRDGDFSVYDAVRLRLQDAGIKVYTHDGGE